MCLVISPLPEVGGAKLPTGKNVGTASAIFEIH
jgi:hypothetical protein